MSRAARRRWPQTNTANRCHAGAVRPAGTGANQMPIAIANGAMRLSSRPTSRSWSLALCACLAESNAALEADRAALDRTVIRLDHEFPGELVRTALHRHTGRCRRGSSPRCGCVSAVPSPLSSLNTWSPRSSVQTPRPTRPVSLSTSAMTSARKPTPGRPFPASSIVPRRSRIEPFRSAPSGIVRRLPAAFHEPANSCTSLALRRLAPAPLPARRRPARARGCR